jgi:CRP-like cAMP-binding protein
LGFLLVVKRLDKRTAQLAVRFRTFSEFVPLVVAIGLVEAYLRLPLAATFGRGRLRDPDVLLPPFKREKSMASVSAIRNSSPPRNQLLAGMSANDFASLEPHLQPVPMALLKDMERPNRRIETVYFMENGIASVVAVQPDETRVEVGLIGREGMSGIAVVLGGDQSPHSTYVQVAGEGQRITASALRKAMNASRTLQSLLLKFVQVFMVQTAHTAIANARAPIDQRLARWILMAHDRTSDNTLPLTHEFISLMLGVRRAGVTEALNSLKRRKLIDTGRNKIVVLNRKGIERAAGKSYGTPEKEYRRLIG